MLDLGRHINRMGALMAVALLCGCASGPVERTIAWDMPDPGSAASLRIDGFESDAEAGLIYRVSAIRERVNFSGTRAAVRFIAPGNTRSMYVLSEPDADTYVVARLRALVGAHYAAGLPELRALQYDLITFFAQVEPQAVGSMAEAVIAIDLRIGKADAQPAFQQVFACQSSARGVSLAAMGEASLLACMSDLLNEVESSDDFWSALEG